jgi:hypothetical protein
MINQSTYRNGAFNRHNNRKTAATPRRLAQRGIIDQMKAAFYRQNRLALVTGTVLCGFVPAATYTIKHACHETPMLWLLVAGGLIYSATSMFAFMTAATGCRAKAAGWVILVEGVMTFAPKEYWPLSLAALAILVTANAIAGACKLADDSAARR